MKPYAALLSSVLAVLAVSCDSAPMKMVERMFDLEARAAKGAPPSTVEELKAAIAEWSGKVEKTIEAQDKVAMYWRLLAVRYMDKGMYGPALEATRKALEFYPDNSGLYYVAGVSAAHLSGVSVVEPGAPEVNREAWLRTAEESYKRSVELEPRNTRSWYALAVLYSFEMDRFEEAVAAADKVLAIDTGNIDAMFVRARSLYGSGALQEAADEYERIIKTSKLEAKREQAALNRKAILDELYGP